MADRVGQRLGNYRLVRLLGQGGFAEVYLGEHIHLDTLAAIKVLYTQLDSEDMEQFHTEARTIARLIHPHIVRVFDYGVTETTPFLVMDYAPHGTLRKRYPKGALLPISTVASYVTQLADALQYAHEQKVIHRDIKPENMLLGRRYEVLLSDFGIALVAKSSRYFSTQGLQDLAGTIAYMAPEQIQAQARPNSDQYSLGIVVYEWLSGTRPFQGTFTEVAVKHTLAPPPSLRKIVPALPDEIEEVVMKALDKDPTQRFASVQEFAIAFEQACQQGQVSPFATHGAAVSPEQPPSPDAALQLDQEVFSTILFTAPDLPSTSGLAPYEPALPPVETSVLDQSLASTQSSQLPRRGIARRRLLQGLAGVGLVSAVGGGIALLRYTQGARNAATPHGPANRVGTTLFTYRGHTNWVWSVAWSPDGKRIASASGDETAQVWDALDGDHLNRYNGHAASVYAVAWDPIRGTAALPVERIASASYDKTVQIWDPMFGDHFYTYTGHTDWVWSVAWSPDGRRIASAGGEKRCRSGMPRMVAMSIRFAAMQLLSTLWHGLPTASTLLRPAPMARCRSGMRHTAFISILFNRIPRQSGRWRGHLTAGALPRRATIKRCRCGMPLMAITSIFITAIAILSMPWHGHPMADASPRRGVTKQYRSGMQRVVATSIRFTAIQLLSMPWHGHPTASTLLRPAPMARYRSGMRLTAFISIPFNRIQRQSGRWRGHLTVGALLLHATTKRCRFGMPLMAITSIFITAIAILSMPWPGRPMASILPRLVMIRRCRSGMP